MKPACLWLSYLILCRYSSYLACLTHTLRLFDFSGSLFDDPHQFNSIFKSSHDASSTQNAFTTQNASSSKHVSSQHASSMHASSQHASTKHAYSSDKSVLGSQE